MRRPAVNRAIAGLVSVAGHAETSSTTSPREDILVHLLGDR